MANQVIVTANNTVQVAIEPTPNVEVTISRAVVGTISNVNVNNANYANFAGTAFNVNASNVTGLGNVATINLDGSSSNVLYGNGVFAAATSPSVANANYANFAGTAYSVSGSNVTGAVANATFATTAGSANTSNIASVAYSVSGSNVTGAVANATFATRAGTVTTNAQPNITSVGTLTSLTASGNITSTGGRFIGNAAGLTNIPGANVTGTVANAAYAANSGYSNNSGNANVANVAYSVNVANVAGIGNIATVNLDGNVANVLKGNGTFGPEGSTGNANYANYAGTAYSVDGANVVGSVNDAVFASTAGSAYSVDGANVAGEVASAASANIANEAYLVAGANVSGEVANAGYATTAGYADTANSSNYADIANTAYAVDVANVSGIGNIATINLDGNASNLLDGTGTWVAIPTPASSNYANFAGQVVDNTQSNITTVGNLTTLTINNGVANTVTSQFNPNLITLPTTFSFGNAVSVVKTSGITGTLNQVQPYYFIKDRPGNAAASNNDFISRTVYGAVSSTGNIAVASDFFNQVRAVPGTANAYVPGSYSWRNGLLNSNLANPNTFTTGFVTMTQSGTFAVTAGAPGSGGINLSTFGTQNGTISNTAPASALVISRGRGNADSRLTVEPNDYIGDITWNGVIANGAAGSQSAKLRAKIDSAYVANTTTMPIGFELQTVNNTGTLITHNFYANGNVAFSNDVAATTFTGTLTTNAQPNITSLGRITDFQTANGINNFINEPNAQPIIWTFSYGDGAGGQTLSYVRRRNGNSAARQGVIAGDYLGNLEWAGAKNTAGSSFGTAAKIAPRVDTSYTGPSTTAAAPTGIEFQVVDSNDIAYLHTFYANGNVQFNNAVSGNVITANYLYGDGSNISNISATASPAGSNTQIQFNDSGSLGASNNLAFDKSSQLLSVGNGNVNIFGSNKQIQLNGIGEQPPANGVYSSMMINNGSFSLNQDNIGGGLGTFAFTMYDDTNSYINPYTFYRARGNASSPQPVANNDIVMSQSFFAYGDSGNTYVTLGSISAACLTNDGAGNLSSMINISTQNNNDGSAVNLYSDNVNLNGNSLINLNANYVSLNGFSTSINLDNNVSVTGDYLNIYANVNVNGNAAIDMNGNITAKLLDLASIQLDGNTQFANIGGVSIDGGNGIIAVPDQIQIASGTISLDGGTGRVTATESAIANTQLNQFQETVYAYGNATGTISPDFSLGSIQKLTLTGNITMNSLTNAQAGRSMTLILTQDATGGRTLTSSMKFAGASKTLSTAANAIDIVSVFYDGTTYYASLSKGYA